MPNNVLRGSTKLSTRNVFPTEEKPLALFFFCHSPIANPPFNGAVTVAASTLIPLSPCVFFKLGTKMSQLKGRS